MNRVSTLSLSPSFGPEGFQLIAALYSRAFEDPWPAPAIRELLASIGTWALIGLSDEEPAAFLLTRVIVDEAEILSIGVDPAHRRKGLARMLLEAGFKAMRKRGAVRCFLEVGRDNPGAIDLYLGLGFEPVGCRKNYYRRADGNRVDALLMQKKLTDDPPSIGSKNNI